MPRRCLDCDHIYAAMRTCPKCGSKQQLILPNAPSGPEPIQLNAYLAVAHALIMAGVTLFSPGIGLGTLLFAEGLCGILVIVGTERAQRALAPIWIATMFAQVGYLVMTKQPTTMGIGIALTFFAAFHALPWQSFASTIAYAIAWVLNLLLVVGLVLFAINLPPPGWWHGEHPPMLTIGKAAVQVIGQPKLPADRTLPVEYER